MFILIVSNGYPTKQYKRGIFAMDQAKALKSAGHKVALIALDLRSIRRKRKLGYERLTVDGIDVFSVSFPLGRVPSGLSERVSRAALRSAYRRAAAELGRPDVIHAHFYDMGAAAGALSRETGIPLVITEHFSGLNRDSISGKLQAAAVRSYSCADELIAVSSSFRDRLKEHTGFDFRVIPNVVDTENYSGVSKNRASGQGRFSFVSVGNLFPGKGFSDLLDAFRKAVDEGAGDIYLTIVGKGPELRNLEQQACDLGIADRVRFTGQLDRSEIAELYGDSQCFVLLSKGETFGVAYVEAMASGLPVIATACGGPEDFVNEQNGILVQLNDEEAYAKALLDMVRSAGEYDSEKIREEAISRVSPEKTAEKLQEVYEEAILKHGV